MEFDGTIEFQSLGLQAIASEFHRISNLVSKTILIEITACRNIKNLQSLGHFQ